MIYSPEFSGGGGVYKNHLLHLSVLLSMSDGPMIGMGFNCDKNLLKKFWGQVGLKFKILGVHIENN